MKGNFLAIVLVVIGVVALGMNLGLFDLDLVGLARTWWPLLLIALGVALFFTPEMDSRRKE